MNCPFATHTHTSAPTLQNTPTQTPTQTQDVVGCWRQRMMRVRGGRWCLKGRRESILDPFYRVSVCECVLHSVEHIIETVYSQCVATAAATIRFGLELTSVPIVAARQTCRHRKPSAHGAFCYTHTYTLEHCCSEHWRTIGVRRFVSLIFVGHTHTHRGTFGHKRICTSQDDVRQFLLSLSLRDLRDTSPTITTGTYIGSRWHFTCVCAFNGSIHRTKLWRNSPASISPNCFIV